VISLPNVVSFARLLSVPLAIWLMLDGNITAAFWVFIAAGVSDAIDGYLAKRFNARTELGAYLDPLADKALLVATYLTLGWLGHLPSWLVILVVFRDLMIVGGALVVHALTQSFRSRPMMISKINTALQIALVTLVLARLGLGFDDFGMSRLLVVAVAVTTVLSGVAYLVHWGRKLARLEGSQ
jgi:cardiolipin synthase (CMP-forming)